MARRRRNLRGTFIPGPGKCEITPSASMSDVRSCIKACGSHWFDRDTMRFFRSRVGRSAFADGHGGAYFVSSEQFNAQSPRLYSVRYYDPKHCNVETIGKFQGYSSQASATATARRLARGGGSNLQGARRRRRRR